MNGDAPNVSVMQNKKVIQLLLMILFCYFIFQIVLYTYLHKTRSDTQDNNIQFEGPKTERDKFVSFNNIQDFVVECHNHGIPVMLLDPTVLQRVINMVPSTTKQCNFFCDLANVTVFGVLSQLWAHDSAFLNAVGNKGFKVYYTTENNPSTIENPFPTDSVLIHTHYLIQRYAHVIHLVILYHRPAGYWWHGQLGTSMTIYGEGCIDDVHIYKESNASFMREGAYDVIELIKVTMDGIRLRAPRYPKLFLEQLHQSDFICCNQSRAKIFHALYGAPNEESKIFRDVAKDTLFLVKKTLDYLGIEFWLSSGTCLGWFRQCDTISYSEDVDIGIWIKDYDRRLIPGMQEAGFTLKFQFGKESDSFELSFYNGDMKLDIFFFYEEEDHVWNGGTQAKTGNKYKYIFPKFSLCWTEFLGLKVHVPCNPEAYIEANYGKNWFEPVKSWDWKSSPPNVRPNGKWPEDERSKVILSFS